MPGYTKEGADALAAAIAGSQSDEHPVNLPEEATSLLEENE